MSVIEVEFPGNLAQVETATDLRAMPTSLTPDSDIYLVSGLGIFVYDASSLSPDDGVTILKPDDRTPLQAGRWVISGANIFASAAQVSGAVAAATTFQQQASGSVPRTVLNRLEETISVADFNADPTRPDNTGAIQAAIDAAFARGGGSVGLPYGDYKILGTLQGRRGVSITGQGSLASKLLKIGPGDALVYGTGTSSADPDIERVLVQGFSVIGQPSSGHLFWGRKATTSFAMRDLYFESGNSTVQLDSCYSLVMENVQVRGAETGHNISLGSISHNVTLLQVASQVAKAGAGLYMTGCYTVAMIGGKLEFNAQDQWLVGTGCRGISALGVYIEGIQPSSTGYAGVQIKDVDTFVWLGGLVDATQSGPMGTNGTGTYFKVSGAASRVNVIDYGFVSIANSQIHVEFGPDTFDCRARIPSGARATSGNINNRVYGSVTDEVGLLATNSMAQTLVHNTPAALMYGGEIIDPKNQFSGGTTFQPADNGVYEIKGFFQVLNLPAGCQVNVRLQDISGGMDTRAILVSYPTAGSPTITYDFTEFLDPTHQYQIQVTLIDSAGQSRSLATTEQSKRLSARRVA